MTQKEWFDLIDDFCGCSMFQDRNPNFTIACLRFGAFFRAKEWTGRGASLWWIGSGKGSGLVGTDPVQKLSRLLWPALCAQRELELENFIFQEL